MSDINNLYGNIHNSKRNPYVALLLLAAKYLTIIIHTLCTMFTKKKHIKNFNKMTYCMQVCVESPDYL